MHREQGLEANRTTLTPCMNERRSVHVRPWGQDATSEADMAQSLANLVQAPMLRLLRVQKFFLCFFFFFSLPFTSSHLSILSLYPLFSLASWWAWTTDRIFFMMCTLSFIFCEWMNFRMVLICRVPAFPLCPRVLRGDNRPACIFLANDLIYIFYVGIIWYTRQMLIIILGDCHVCTNLLQ